MNLGTEVLHPNPCQICGYIFGDVHHIWPRSRGGERFVTFVLCPNDHRYANIIQAMVIQGHPIGNIERFGSRYFQAKFRPYIVPLVAEQLRIMWALGMRLSPEEMPLLKVPPLPKPDPDPGLDWDGLPFGPVSLQHARTVGRHDPPYAGPMVLTPLQEAITKFRPGDRVRMGNSRVLTVISTAAGYVHTDVGSYNPWGLRIVNEEADGQ